MQGYIETFAGNAQRDHDELIGRAVKQLEVLNKRLWVSDVIREVQDGRLDDAVSTLQTIWRGAVSINWPEADAVSKVADLIRRAQKLKGGTGSE
jgi:hypothetical protein